MPILKLALISLITSIVVITVIQCYNDRDLLRLIFSNRKVDATIERTGSWLGYDYSFDGSTDRFHFGPKGMLYGYGLSEAYNIAKEKNQVAVYVGKEEYLGTAYGTYAHPFLVFIRNLIWPCIFATPFLFALLVVRYWRRT